MISLCPYYHYLKSPTKKKQKKLSEISLSHVLTVTLDTCPGDSLEALEREHKVQLGRCKTHYGEQATHWERER